MKPLFMLIGAVGAFLLLALALFAGCTVHSIARFVHDGGHSGIESTRSEIKALDPQHLARLSAELAYGDLAVEEGTAAMVTATFDAWAGTQADADALAARMQLEITSEGDGTALRVPEEQSKSGWNTGKRCDLRIVLPRNTTLTLRTSSGEIDVRGALGACTLHSDYGAVKARGIAGDVQASSSSGDVLVQDVHAASVKAHSDYGALALRNLEITGPLEIAASSGDVSLSDVHAERVSIASSYGDVRLERVQADVQAKLSSGDLQASDLGGTHGQLSSSYGSLNLRGAKGEYELSTESGDVHVEHFEGRLRAHSSYGSVNTKGLFHALELTSSSGDVSAEAEPGSTLDAAWRLDSSYGGVSLRIPSELDLDLDASTDYGSVKLDVPGEKPADGDRKSVRVHVGKGGPSLRMHTSSGDVRLIRHGNDR